jgi:hypothetical protein
VSIASIFFCALIVLLIFSFGMSVRDSIKKREDGWPAITLIVALISIAYPLIHIAVIKSDYHINQSCSPVDSPKMELSMLHHAASQHVKTLDGYMITGVGTFYFLGNGESGKNRKVSTYYAYKHGGAAYFSSYRKYSSNASTHLKGLERLARQCVMNGYHPACEKMVNAFTYTPGWVPILPESKPKLFINAGKPLSITSLAHANQTDFKKIH